MACVCVLIKKEFSHRNNVKVGLRSQSFEEVHIYAFNTACSVVKKKMETQQISFTQEI